MGICPFCKSQESFPLTVTKTCVIVKCNNCNLVFTKLPIKYSVKKFNRFYYSEDYISNYEIRKNELKKRFLMRLKEIENIKRGGNLLDVGCSTGLFLRTVHKYSKHKWKLFGIDINRKSIWFAKTKVDGAVFCTSLYKKQFKDCYFDCVTCFDVLEHDADIKGNLAEIYRILKPGGLLVIQAPNHKSVMAYLCGQNWDWWSVPDHVLHFSMDQISSILKHHGFIVIRKTTWEPRNDFILNISGTIRKEFPPFLSANRIFARLSMLPLNMLWFVMTLIEKKFDVGGLLLLYARKAHR